MTGRTHASAGLTAGMALVAAGNLKFEDAVVCVSICTIAALLPDIDEPNSAIGCMAGGFSKLVKKTFGHRGLLHTPEFWIVFLFALVHFGVTEAMCIQVGAGVLTHLILDSLTRTGIPFLVLGGKKLHLMTLQERHAGEKLLFFALHCVTLAALAYRLFA